LHLVKPGEGVKELKGIGVSECIQEGRNKKRCNNYAAPIRSTKKEKQ